MRSAPTSSADQAVARLVASRLRLACVLTGALARNAVGDGDGEGTPLSPPPSSTFRDGIQGWIERHALTALQACLDGGVEAGQIALLRSWRRGRRWLQRQPWRAAGAAALAGACLAGFMARPWRRSSAPWLFLLGLLALLDEQGRRADPACRDLVVTEPPLKRTTGQCPGVFR